MISKIIASRIKNDLPFIVHYNQTGYVKDRYIGETVRSIFDIMDFTEKKDIPGLLIFIDFKKSIRLSRMELPFFNFLMRLILVQS